MCENTNASGSQEIHSFILLTGIMKKKQRVAVKKTDEKKPKPNLKWQSGDYSRSGDFKFLLPYQFLLLCKLMEITPLQVIRDFMHNLDCGSWKREGRDMAKQKLIEYFIEQGYGQRHYTSQDIQQIFTEMDAIGMLFPANGKRKIIDHYASWREKYHRYWFKKWFRKSRRKIN